jgi:hypothetical protein
VDLDNGVDERSLGVLSQRSVTASTSGFTFNVRQHFRISTLSHSILLERMPNCCMALDSVFS